MAASGPLSRTGWSHRRKTSPKRSILAALFHGRYRRSAPSGIETSGTTLKSPPRSALPLYSLRAVFCCFSVLYLRAFGPPAVLVTSEVRSALECSQVRRPVEDATSERSVLAPLMGVCVAFVPGHPAARIFTSMRTWLSGYVTAVPASSSSSCRPAGQSALDWQLSIRELRRLV